MQHNEADKLAVCNKPRCTSINTCTHTKKKKKKKKWHVISSPSVKKPSTLSV